MMKDTRIEELIGKETSRQKNNIELIASENFCSKDVREAAGSILTNKYAEGYPAHRYYGGCEYIDEIEQLAIDRACELFGADHANVQPHSGSQANMAVYFSVLNTGDRVLGMDLAAGGHLTHGAKVSFSGKLYDFWSYGVDPETECINYDTLKKTAMDLKPKMIVAGASAYAREIDFKAFREIADACGAMLMVDMAHIAGIVAAGYHMNPVPYADFVTTTTHKTLRGPRGGMVLCREQYKKALNKALFPGMQGGPLCHIVAGKAVCLYEAMQDDYKKYIQQVLVNCDVMAEELKKAGFRLVSGGTDNHLVLVDTMSMGITGREAEETLDKVHITCNKNSIPFDTLKPGVTSGIRLGSAAMTTRGFTEEEFRMTANWITKALLNRNDEAVLAQIKEEVIRTTDNFLLP